MLKAFPALLSLLLCVSVSIAAPVLPKLFTIAQPDGTELRIRGYGDENFHWQGTADRLPVAQGADGWWYYATFSPDGTLNPTTRKAGIDTPPVRGLNALTPPSVTRNIIPNIQKPSAGRTLNAPTPRKLLVVGVSFANQTLDMTASQLNATFFGNTNSVKAYFNEVSGGNATISPAEETHGTVNDGVVIVNMGGNHPQCEITTNEPYSSPTLNATEECYQYYVRQYISAALPSLSNPSGYPVNLENEVEPADLGIIMIIAGYEDSYGTTAPNRVGGHQWELYNFPSSPTAAGKEFPFYALFGEYHADSTTDPNKHFATIGIMVHELGHLLFGFPDLYDTRSGGMEGIGQIDVMGSGSWAMSSTDTQPGQSPVHPSGWLKQFAGWKSFTTPTDGTLTFLNAAAGGAVYKLTTGSSEYFIAENRFQNGYDAGLAEITGFPSTGGGGIAVYHVNESVLASCINTNRCNVPDPTMANMLLRLVEADGNNALTTVQSSFYQGRLADLFFSGNTLLSTRAGGASFISPDADYYNGNDSGVSLTSISTPAATMTALYTADTSVTPPPSPTPTGGSGGGGGGCSAGQENDFLLLLAALSLVAYRIARHKRTH